MSACCSGWTENMELRWKSKGISGDLDVCDLVCSENLSFPTRHQCSCHLSGAVAGSIFSQYRQVVHFSTPQLVQLTGSCVTPTGNILMGSLFLSENDVGYSSSTFNPGHSGCVWTTLQDTGHIYRTTRAWRNRQIRITPPESKQSALDSGKCSNRTGCRCSLNGSAGTVAVLGHNLDGVAGGALQAGEKAGEIWCGAVIREAIRTGHCRCVRGGPRGSLPGGPERVCPTFDHRL